MIIRGVRPVFQNLDTTYVNLAALLRYLQNRRFKGRVLVELQEYTAVVVLNGSDPPEVNEMDHTSGRSSEGSAALQRLLVRSTTPGGLISVFESVVDAEAAAISEPRLPAAPVPERRNAPAKNPADDPAWGELLLTAGQLFAAIERVAQAAGYDFHDSLRKARLALADDYPFLDPGTARFTYSDGTVELTATPGEGKFVSGIAECLRRAVDNIAATAPSAESGKGFRDNVAQDLGVFSRRHQTQLERFKIAPRLERIAGKPLP